MLGNDLNTDGEKNKMEPEDDIESGNLANIFDLMDKMHRIKRFVEAERDRQV